MFYTLEFLLQCHYQISGHFILYSNLVGTITQREEHLPGKVATQIKFGLNFHIVQTSSMSLYYSPLCYYHIMDHLKA